MTLLANYQPSTVDLRINQSLMEILLHDPPGVVERFECELVCQQS